MSTGLDCGFIKAKDGTWTYEIERWDNREEYDSYGPFATYEKAVAHLSANHANPGGWWVDEA
jgi:hypothetical protein